MSDTVEMVDTEEDGIIVTAAMIAAGSAAVEAYNRDFCSPDDKAEEVYKEMERVRRSSRY